MTNKVKQSPGTQITREEETQHTPFWTLK